MQADLRKRDYKDTQGRPLGETPAPPTELRLQEKGEISVCCWLEESVLRL